MLAQSFVASVCSLQVITFLGELSCIDGIQSCLYKCRGLHEQAAINAPNALVLALSSCFSPLATPVFSPNKQYVKTAHLLSNLFIQFILATLSKDLVACHMAGVLFPIQIVFNLINYKFCSWFHNLFSLYYNFILFFLSFFYFWLVICSIFNFIDCIIDFVMILYNIRGQVGPVCS